MKLVDIAVARPVTVASGVSLLLLFGILAMIRIPVELTPDVIKPQITVTTRWRGASPEEVEKEIVQEQEEQLKGVAGMIRMTSSSTDSQGSVTLEFLPGTDLDAALVEVGTRLQQVPEYPAQADEPVVRTVDPSANAMAWFVVKALPGNDREIQEYRDFIEDYVKARFERVPGVAISNVFGGVERELQVVIHPDALISRGLSVDDVRSALDRENINISAGDLDEGKRRYVVRTLGEYKDPTEVEAVVIRDLGDTRIYVRDIGEARLGFKEPDGLVRQKGIPTVAVNVIQERGSNSLVVMEYLQAAAAELQEGVLRENGLSIEQVYDQTVYIRSALLLVRSNIFIGGVLAIVILLLFLRQVSPTIVVAASIPISVIGTFLGMALLGRTINVISLAGMAFAVGMVVDNAIVVLENIVRHRTMGESASEAARKGTTEVWGAILASSLTTVTVFLPILFMVEQAGQLFRDLAVAVCCAVGLSLVVSITVIPSLAAQIVRRREAAAGFSGRPPLQLTRIPEAIAAFVRQATDGTARQLAVVVAVTGVALGAAWLLLPRAEYLPRGNRNLIIGILLPPPGYNLDEVVRIGQRLEDEVRPHWEDPPKEPGIENFFFVARGRSLFLGASARDAAHCQALIPLVRGPLGNIPGLIPIVQQTSLFQSGLAQGRSIDIELTGPDLNQLIEIGGRVFGSVRQMYPTGQARPIPSLDLGSPEIHILPKRERLSEVGLTAEELGRAMDVLLDGSPVSEYQYQGEEIDLTLMGVPEKTLRTQDFETLRLRTANGELVTVGSVADVLLTTGPEEVQHVERERAITIQLIPPEDIPLETVMNSVRDEVLAPLRDEGLLQPPYSARLAGTVDDLVDTLRALRGNFVLALLISYFLMAALFESFLHPLIILFSVPLAAVGGLVGLRLVNLIAFQPMDVLTMLGFIILIGIVVNNPILIVHQALNLIRSGSDPHDAIIESVRTRVRPIFMTVFTTVFGMLPLVIMPGAGSELYRGLGSVIVGGLFLSAVFTLLLVPALFLLVLRWIPARQV